MQGWIKLHRKIQEHWLYQEKRKFSRFEAWIDLLLIANHEDAKIALGNELIEVKRGQRITSIRQLCDRWGWSNTKVIQFLKLLQNDGMLTVKSDSKKTLITIENYDFYQGTDDKKATENRHESDTKQTKKHTNKNVKNDKNEKENITTTTEDPVVLFQQLICQLSPLQVQKLDDWVNTFNDKEIINEAIRIADDKNKRYYGFVEYLLKEWHDNRLNSVDTVRSYERNKFAKTKDEYSSRKKVIRQEPVPAWLNNYNLQKKEKEPEVDEAFKKDIEERLKKYKKEA